MTDANPPSEKPTHEQIALQEVLALAERLVPGISASIERDLTADRKREAERQYTRPSSVSAAEWEAGELASLTRMVKDFRETVEGLLVAGPRPDGGPPVNMGFEPRYRIRGIASVARSLDQAEVMTVRETAWKTVTDEVDRLYKEFCDVPNFPRLPKLRAELAWRLAAAAAGTGRLKRVRELRDEIADEGG